MKLGGTLEEEWQSYFTEVLAKQGLGPEAQAGLRWVFFSGAGSALTLLQSVPPSVLRDEIQAFTATLPGRSH